MKSILVVDDEFGLGEAVSDILEDVGYAITIARHCHEGLALIVEVRPLLLMVDLVMPIMNGAEMIAAVRRHPVVGRTRAVLMSSLTERMVGDTGHDAFLTKPFGSAELVATVQAQIGPPDLLH